MKRIVIMGASSGIGLHVAEALASRGIKVGMAARHTAMLKTMKEKYPEMVEYASIDVTRSNAPQLLGKLIERLGGMDIYFHVSGIGYENLELDPQREVDIINTNACGFARMISAAYRYFRDNHVKGARIAAVTSVAGTNGLARLAAYSASKRCAQTYLTALEQLANNEGTDVTFTDIRPGWVRTPLLHNECTYPMEMTLDYVVPRIISAIVHRRRVAVIDWRWNLLVGAWRCVPNAIWTLLDVPVASPAAALPAPGTEPFPTTEEEQEVRHEDSRPD